MQQLFRFLLLVLFVSIHQVAFAAESVNTKYGLLQVRADKDDKKALVRQSHNNPGIQQMYAKFAGKPLSPLAEELFHTRYVNRTKLG